VSKVVVDGNLDQFRWVFLRPLLQVDPQADWCVKREFPGPTYYEFFSVIVQILFDEGRGIHRIEELAYVTQIQLDCVRMHVLGGDSFS
jgi:hypothetical protein